MRTSRRAVRGSLSFAYDQAYESKVRHGALVPSTQTGSGTMRLNADEARSRLTSHVHGVLCTVHPDDGPDAIPVVYAVSGDGHIGLPIDHVKAKTSSRLQREKNLAAYPRAALLVERWEPDDWSRLWWVRARLEHVPHPSPTLVEELTARLATAIPQYVDRPFHHVIVCRILALSGWAASNES